MKYMLLTYLDEKAWAKLGEVEQQKAMAECDPIVRELVASGKFLSGAPLHPTSMTTTVTVREGKRIVTDGPFIETREQLGGYTLLNVKDLDEAISVAGSFVGSGSSVPVTIEIRPVMENEMVASGLV